MLEIELLVRSSIFLFFLLSNILWGQTHSNSKIDSLLKDGIENIILQKYDAASNSFSYLEKEFPRNPLGCIYIAAAKIAEAVDYEEELDEDLIDSLLSNAEDKVHTLLEEDEDNIWNNYYDALIYGYRAYFKALSGNIVTAFSDGVFSLRAFQTCLELDPNFYEAYIALGTYNYWKSAQSKSLLWLPFISDNRDEGIHYLEKAIKNSSYNKYLAAYSLAWIYIDFGESQKAVDLSLKMLKDYKESRYFRWCLARAYQDIDKSKAIDVFREILTSIEKLPNRNYFNDVVIRHKIAMLLYELGDYDSALKLCDEILDFNVKSDKIKERLSNRLERTKQLRLSLLEKLKK